MKWANVNDYKDEDTVNISRTISGFRLVSITRILYLNFGDLNAWNPF